ncbi:MAG: hypothetical protein J6B50_00925 [Lachnospiraceae bacterium]|nr:hypothetical protein [Lachnospiraceae bacterium]
MSKDIVNYLHVDLRRAFLSWRFLASVCLILFLFYFTTIQHGDMCAVYMVSLLPAGGIGGMILWSAAVLPYGTVYIDEKEYGYIKNVLIRGTKQSYLTSKIITVFLSSFVAMFLGFGCFIILKSLSNSFLDSTTQEELVRMNFGNGYCFVIEAGIRISLLAGVLSVIALYVSLFTKKRMLVWAMPVVFVYLEDMVVYRLLGAQLGKYLSLFESMFNSLSSFFSDRTRISAYVLVGAVFILTSELCRVRFGRMIVND